MYEHDSQHIRYNTKHACLRYKDDLSEIRGETAAERKKQTSKQTNKKLEDPVQAQDICIKAHINT